MTANTTAFYIDCTGLTVYMTRDALQKLASELSRISEAPPQECFEIHVRSAFSQFDENDNYSSPVLRSGDGLAAMIEGMHAAIVQDAIQRGEEPADALPSPFELTFMHVGPEGIEKVATQADD
ncbi:hypothetical protein [Mesorhizobium sp.]|uniref:hypothetical protein n=1 Tax=Mesorhizobium sp. TaxID=1871066 RepID=UPI000FE8FBFC|nr:hypothetical protein [Mesorhizobium sp.]RWD69754.1 MAG: hypothetical protein EOS37_16935 [Mesorhizobium sp.]TIV58601.1 MAG: hypothetical protein E5V80_17720 [Mesorhizobium sp.]TIW17526.1 MAG: hypothetical protein E5V81_20070 [Mesorhizobium sp.]